jgi:hypothetical protein
MAAQLGTAAPFGLTFETGVITENIAHSFSTEEKTLRDGDGDVTGWTGYNETCEFSFDGYVPTATPFASKLGINLTLITALPAFFTGTPTAKNVIKTINSTRTNEDYQKIAVGGTAYPLLA